MALFKSLKLGDLELSHRIALAPLTRLRANNDTLAPTKLAQEYYEQRATPGGLLISEATCISPEALIGNNVPGIWSKDQTEGWKKVVDAVHAKNGLISMQLWHTGRAAHDSMGRHPMADPERMPTVGPSDIPAPGKTFGTITGESLDYSKPRALTEEDISRIVDDYRRAARNAREAGVDAIEIHAAHGYLIDQFLNDNPNNRMDKYGGSIENRCRFLKEVLAAVGEEMPFTRIGVRISPQFEGTRRYYGCEDSNALELYSYVIRLLDSYDLAYLLLTEPRWTPLAYDDDHAKDPGYAMGLHNPQHFRKLYRGPIIGAGGFTPITGNDAVKDGLYDAIAFGRWFISNPDLVRRIREGLPLTPYHRDSFYKLGSPDGYIDYPMYDDIEDKSKLVSHDRIGKSLSELKTE
mmetsp:Transcript_15316/g.29701  ORF Transcript_15316/g.29701 Transcript_15316/m.29701 type:complete len:407 (-) Transcript_15316:53-1273(-)